MLRSGKAYCWGDNTYGQLGNKSTISSSVPVAVYTGGVLSGVTLTQISAGDFATCALSSTGAAYCWGYNASGELGNNSTVNSSVPVAVSTAGVLSGVTLTEITAEYTNVCALSSTGAAYCWGQNNYGQLGNNNGIVDSSVPVAVYTAGVLSGVTLTQIVTGVASSCALSSTGAAYCWGYDGYGGLGNGTTSAGAQSTPVLVSGGRTLTQISAGYYGACALTGTGAAYCWGYNFYGELGNNSTTNSNVPVAVNTAGVLSGVTLVQITVGGYTTCALDSSGLAYCWGNGQNGQLGNGTSATNNLLPVAVTTSGVLSGMELTQVSNGGGFTCALDNTGAAYCWGLNSSGELGNPDTAKTFLVPVEVTSQATMITSGGTHSCLLRNGKAYCWGNNAGGALGINSASPTQSLVPLAVYTGGALSGKTLIQIGAGVNWTCALDTAGAAYCWGNNNSGAGDATALGNGTMNVPSNAPVLVSNSGTTLIFTQLSVGSDFACALTSAGVAYCWGNNHQGQVGNSGTGLATTPQAVTTSGALTGLTLTQIDAGGDVALGNFACAQASTGAAFCWGLGTSGQLGNSASATTNAPVAVTASGVLSGVTVTQIATGGSSSCALGTAATAGAAFCWGLGTSGQLGNSASATSNVPVTVTATGVLSGVTLAQVSGGDSFACALGIAGAAFCWGLGTSGQLGNSASATSNVPVAVSQGSMPTGTTLFQISSGTAHTCTQDTTGAFYCWGDNANGDLGNNSTTLSNVPVTVQGIVPGAPTSVAAFPGNTTATVYWVAPVSLGTGALTGYTVTASPGGAVCTTVSALTCTITGLSNGTTYSVTVVTNTTDGPSPPSTATTVTPWPPGTIAAGKGHSCTIFNGNGYCWGDNTNGELGNNTSSGTAQATAVAVDTAGVLSGKTLTQIGAGQNFTCALDSTGHAYCWGLNSAGQLGNNNLGVDSHVPVAVNIAGVLSGKTLTQISVGLAFACALDSAGIAYCWGAGQEGELGNNTVLTNSAVPVAVNTAGVLSSKTLTQISAGYDHACVLDTAGVTYCWGFNGNGGLGNNSQTQSPVAVIAAGALTGKIITQISAGNKFSCGLDSTGLAYCWGLNTHGQLGINSTTQSLVPVAMTTAATAIAGKTITQISVTSNDHSCALDAAGVAYCWGADNHGQVGNNSIIDSLVAVAVTTAATPMSGQTIAQISSGYAHTCSMDAAGTAYCWGLNATGQVGNNSISESHVAVFVAPQGPTGVGATPGDATAAISWTAPVFLNNGTITGYAAVAAPGGASCTTTTATLCTISGLTDGTTYTITVTVTATTGTASGATVTVLPVGPLTLTSPSSLTWAVTGSGVNQSVADAVAGDQQFTVSDGTAPGVGWHITVSATTFTNGTHALPNAGAMNFTGSLTSSLAITAPTATCVGSCTLPTNTTNYPVLITTAVSSPTIYTTYDTSAATGRGVMTIGGSTAANPIGWWVQVPASTYAGTYTTTVSLAIISGP